MFLAKIVHEINNKASGWYVWPIDLKKAYTN